VWLRIEVRYHDPVSTQSALIVLDRHGGVVSGFNLSTEGEEPSDADRAMVENITRLAAERLQGGNS
jgi:hypothetical protein